MKRKSLMLILLSVIMIPILTILNACTLGACTIKFETWGGSNAPREVTLEPGKQISSSYFTSPSKTGYKFLNWCYDKALTKSVTFPMIASNGTYTYYAKYEIDLDYFNVQSFYISWPNDQNSIYLDDSLTAYNSLTFMLDKTTMNEVFDSITITPTNAEVGQGIFIDSISVSDENGKLVEDSDSNEYVFKPKTTLSKTTQFQYVIKITAGARGGDFKITFN